MAYLYALITAALCVFVYGCAAMTSAQPYQPIWPPKRFDRRARIITWTVTILALGSAYLAGSASWNAWGLPDWIRWFVGFPIVLVTSSVSSYAIIQLGLDQSMGAVDGLKTNGLFGRTRNPTYIANIALCFGFVLLAASTPALIAAGTLAVLYVKAVRHEEVWLTRTYGRAYTDYQASVPRWF